MYIPTYITTYVPTYVVPTYLMDVDVHHYIFNFECTYNGYVRMYEHTLYILHNYESALAVYICIYII